MKITLSNISSYIEGNFKYYKNELLDSPEYIKEQVYYRLYICKDDCVKKGKCKHCGCPPYKKSWVKESCNHGELFPNLMDKPSWNQFKLDNNIDIEYLKENE